MSLSRLSANSLWLLLSRLGVQLGLALFTILLARELGPAVFGEYAFMAAMIVVGNVLTTFGTDMALIRDIASTDDLSGLPAALLIQIALSALFIGAVVVGTLALPTRDAVAASALRLYSLSMLPLAFYTVFTTALRGRQHMLAYAALNLVVTLMQVLAALWLIWRHGDLRLLAFALLIVQTAASLSAGMLCAVRVAGFRQAVVFSPAQVMPVLRASAPIAFLGVLGIIYQRFSLLVLPSLVGASATGWFSAAARLVEAAKTGHVAVLIALYPVMARAYGSRQSGWPLKFRLPGLTLVTMAVLASVGINLLATSIVRFLFGAPFMPAVAPVRILSWGLIPYAANSFLTLALLARRDERVIVGALALSIVALISLTLWWTPVAGAVGAAWAAVSGELIQAVLLVLGSSRRLSRGRSRLAALLSAKVPTEF